MSNQYLKLRRSAVPGKIPDTASLDFGEIALNTYDGLAFMKKSGSSGIEIVTIGSTVGAFTGSFSGSFTGSLEGTASWAINAITASHALNVNFDTGSFATTGSNTFKGDQIISGSITLEGGAKITSQYQPNSIDIVAGPGGWAELASNNEQQYIWVDDNGAYIGTNWTSGSYGWTFDRSGSLILPSNGLLIGTSSWAQNSLTASYFITSSVTSASYAATASFALNFFTSSVNSSSYCRTASFAQGGNGIFSGSFSGSFTGELSNLKGTPSHIPYFSQSQVLADSAMFQVDNGGGSYSIAVNQNGVSGFAPEALFVYQPNNTSFNVISGKGNLNNYLQLNIQNENNGANASSDIVATANNGNENGNYIDMGINGASFSGFLGGPNDAYIYATGSNFHIGNIGPDKHLGFFVGGGDVELDNKLQLNSDNQHQMTGSLDISNNLKVTQDVTASNLLITNTITAQTLVVQTITSSVEYVTGSTKFGSLLTDTHQFTGSVSITSSLLVSGQVNASGITSSLFGTASWAQNFLTSSVTSASYAATASYFLTSSVTNATSASYAATSSWALNFITSSVTSASYAQTASYFITSSVTSASFARTASYFLTSSVTNATSASYAATASWALNFITSSVTSASYAQTASYFLTSSVTNATSASYAATSSWALNFLTSSVTNATSASYAGTASVLLGSILTASYAYTSSWALNFITSSVTSASYAATASYFITSSVTSASYAATSSWALNFLTSSVTSASYAATSSWALNFITSSVTSASYAGTASAASNFIVGNSLTASNALINGTITAQTLVVQTITASVEYSSGSNIFGSQLSNTQQLTGSVTVTGSLSVNGSSVVLSNQTGSMSVATASYASSSISASYSSTASWALNFITSSVTSASYAQTASYFITSSVTNAISSSYAATASWALNFITSSVTSASYAQTASYFVTSSVTSASFATSASRAVTSSYSISSSYAATSSWALNFITSSVTSASYAQTASYFITSSVTSASFASTASYGNNGFIINASQFNNTSSITIAGTTTISSLNTASYISAFYNYAIISSSNARAGQIMSIWSGSSIRFTEVITSDIGSTSTASFAAVLSGGNINLNVTAPAGWNVRTITNLL